MSDNQTISPDRQFQSVHIHRSGAVEVVDILGGHRVMSPEQWEQVTSEPWTSTYLEYHGNVWISPETITPSPAPNPNQTP